MGRGRVVGSECKWKGGAKPDGLVKSNTFVNMNISSCLYQCYCLSSHFTIRYYFIFPQKCKSILYFLHLLGLLTSK